MKFLTKILSVATMMIFMFVANINAQQTTQIQFLTDPGKAGLNVFESSKINTVEYDGLKIRVGGDFALQFQGFTQTNSGDSLTELSNNFNLPTANLNFDVQLEDGMRMHLRTYLSSKHHTEAYVKGGYLQIDKLEFIEEDFLSELMEFVTIKVGMDEINYGDTHFRRSDNARALHNPFSGNYIMDSFTTEPFAEVTVQKSGFLGVLGATNGRLNQKPTPGDDGFVVFGKLGYDSQINDDLRFRLTGSFYNSSDKGTRDYIYGGDRAGSRYYEVIDGGDFSGRFNPRYGYQTSFMVNPFVKFQGVEFFGVFETVSNGDDAIGGSYTQLGGELLYRFGANENFYAGGRYNSVTGEQTDASSTREIDRFNIGAGWFMTNNVLAKFEYVKQTYDGNGYNGTLFQGAEFSGVMVEAVIAF